ncbi:MAG: VOC family protein [Proteobacteria bacterium]|nr:VOC family protein [Pseudomonadota bacterium]
MLDHISVAVSDMERARAFYDAVLGTLGYGRVMEFDFGDKAYAGYGPPNKPAFWIYGGYGPVTPGTGAHLAFVAPNRPAVDMFHREALVRGARDEGRPGRRPEYHPNYYGAFVFDPDGHKIEAVCHAPGVFEDQFKST